MLLTVCGVDEKAAGTVRYLPLVCTNRFNRKSELIEVTTAFASVVESHPRHADGFAIVLGQVFEVGDCTIAHSASLQPTATASPRSAPQALEGPVDGPKIASESEQDRDRFSITLSRAFGSVYARAVSLGTGRIRKGHTIMARTKEEDLIPLLSPNWMEK